MLYLSSTTADLAPLSMSTREFSTPSAIFKTPRKQLERKVLQNSDKVPHFTGRRNRHVFGYRRQYGNKFVSRPQESSGAGRKLPNESLPMRRLFLGIVLAENSTNCFVGLEEAFVRNLRKNFIYNYNHIFIRKQLSSLISGLCCVMENKK